LYLFGYIRGQPTGKTELDDKPVFGPYMKTLDIIADQDISEIIIAVPSREEQDTAELIYALHSQPVNLRIVPDYFDLVFLRADVENFGSLPLLTLKEPSLDPFQRLTKRVFDLIVTSVLMIPALPLMGLIAIAIKLDDPGPALFRQERIGEGGKIFEMMKFRTMIIGAEKMQEAMAEINEDGILIHKRPDDPRITRLGHFLRRTSLDELPQFFNILKGDMSLVGPRPEMPWLVDKYDLWQRKRFEVPQGLTGWWQVNGRSDRVMHLHTDEDLFYIRNYSLALDIQIVLRTILVVLTGRGAY
jgi:exopolysaccharide biosynthesis polyprenyl glycosylphosphotransferase